MNDTADIIATLDRLHSATRDLSEGQRDELEALSEFSKALAVLDAKADLRAKQVEELTKSVASIQASIAHIEKPVVDHYDGLRIARETQDANAGKWAVFLSPDRAVHAIKWALPVLAALGVGGGFGANFRGCIAGVQTSADVASPAESATIPAMESAP